MKIRHDAVAVSSVLFTVAFLMLTPTMLMWARTTYQSRFRDIAFYPNAAIPGDQVVIPNYDAPTGITSLAIIAIGLVVTWAGYFKGVRWTWFVMFVIAWVWVFPVLLLPYLHNWTFGTLIGTLTDAIRENWIGRSFVKVALAFLLMMVALVLPVKSFILGQGGGPGESGRANSGAPDKRVAHQR